MRGLVSKVSSAAKAVASKAASMGRAAASRIVGAAQKAKSAFNRGVKAVAAAAAKAKSAAKAIANKAKSLGAAAKNKIVAAAGKARSVFSRAKAKATATLGKGMAKARATASRAWQAIGSFTREAVKGICIPCMLARARGAAANPPKAVLSEKEAADLFKELAARKDIPFDFPVDCCYSRAHEMCRTAEKKGIACQKYWLFDKDWPASPASLEPKKPDGSAVSFPDSAGIQRPVKWVYHVAPIVKVKKSDGTVEDRVIDPSLADRPITKEQWRKIQGDPAGAYGEVSDSGAYFQNQKLGYAPLKDPTGEIAKQQMKDHAVMRDKALKAAKKKP